MDLAAPSPLAHNYRRSRSDERGHAADSVFAAPDLTRGNIVKMIGVLLPGLLLVGLCAMQPASAQDVPPGTYLRSCGHAYLQGGTLIAACLRTDGSAQPTALPAVQYCVGDIGNMNGA